MATREADERVVDSPERLRALKLRREAGADPAEAQVQALFQIAAELEQIKIAIRAKP